MCNYTCYSPNLIFLCAAPNGLSWFTVQVQLVRAVFSVLLLFFQLRSRPWWINYILPPCCVIWLAVGFFSSTVCSNNEVFAVLMTNECLDMRKTVRLKLYTRVQTYFQWTKGCDKLSCPDCLFKVILQFWISVREERKLRTKAYHLLSPFFSFQLLITFHTGKEKEHCKLLNPTDHIFPLLLQIQLNRWCLWGQSHLCFQENTKLP